MKQIRVHPKLVDTFDSDYERRKDEGSYIPKGKGKGKQPKKIKKIKKTEVEKLEGWQPWDKSSERKGLDYGEDDDTDEKEKTPYYKQETTTASMGNWNRYSKMVGKDCERISLAGLSVHGSRY